MQRRRDFRPLPKRGRIRVKIGGKVVRVPVPVYCQRFPWEVVPWVSERAGRPWRDRKLCNIVHVPTGQALLRNPASADTAIAFAIACAGVDCVGDAHTPESCAEVLLELSWLTGEPARCVVCKQARDTTGLERPVFDSDRLGRWLEQKGW